MSLLMSAKRNRSDNFEPADIELLVNLISEHSDIDSQKLDERKKAWDSITSKFNEGCSGIQRDVGALKMKVKNMKAQAKKPKLENQSEDSISETHLNSSSKHTDENDEENETDANQSHSESMSKVRKRCKKFSKGECDLLLKLYEQHCSDLDSSCSASSIKRRSEAWRFVTEDFNKQQTTGIKRDESELKIKIKNIKANRIKSETSSDNLNASNSKNATISILPVSKMSDEKKPVQQSSHLRNIDIITEYYDGDDFDEDEEFIQPIANHTSKEEDKELEKVRRENILLKNAVLKKKERLLELQIALAERNLRRQI